MAEQKKITVADILNAPIPEPAATGSQRFIGVPDTFVAQPGVPVAPVPPRYKQGDDVSEFANRPAHERALIQQALVRGGFIGPNTRFQPGEWDTPTSNAMRQVLALANRTGTEWLEVLADAAENPRLSGGGGGSAAFVDEPFLPPDPTELRSTIRKVISDITKRPSSQIGEDEVEALIDTALNISQLGHAAAQEKERVTFEARQGRQPQFNIASDVDPAARFREEVERRYAPEVERVRKREADQSAGDLAMASIMATARMVGE